MAFYTRLWFAAGRTVDQKSMYWRILNEVQSKFTWISHSLRLRLVLAKLTASLTSTRPIVGGAPVVVSLTSYGSRLKFVHFTILTIANGLMLPRRIILWVSYADAHLVTPNLRSLQRRGLEIRLTADYGSHKKYYPYCASADPRPAEDVSLITADDDVLYGKHWLSALIGAASIEPAPVIVAHRAHRMKVDDGVIRPYLAWDAGAGTVEPSFANVATGVCGVLYPPEFIFQVTRIWSTEFMAAAPSADDLWLHSRAVLLGIRTKQVNHAPPPIIEHHPDHEKSLSLLNVTQGNNDIVVSSLYTPEMILQIQSSGDGHTTN